MLRVLVNMIVEDDFIMDIVDTLKKVIDTVAGSSSADAPLLNRVTDMDATWFDAEGTPMTPIDFSRETYHDRCEDWGKVGSAATGELQHADLMSGFRNDKARTRAWENAYQTEVRKVVQISEKPVPKSMKQSANVTARVWDGWETAADTLDFYH